MKKNIFTRATGLLLAVLCVMASLGNVPAYAAECEGSTTVIEYSNTSLNQSAKAEAFDHPVVYAGHDVFRYATVTYVGAFSFTGTNLTPTKTVDNDPRMHRLIFDIDATQLDYNSDFALFRFTVIRANGDRYSTGWTSVNRGSNEITNKNASDIIPVSPGETIQFYFETTGNSKIWIDYSIYCD